MCLPLSPPPHGHQLPLRVGVALGPCSAIWSLNHLPLPICSPLPCLLATDGGPGGDRATGEEKPGSQDDSGQVPSFPPALDGGGETANPSPLKLQSQLTLADSWGTGALLHFPCLCSILDIHRASEWGRSGPLLRRQGALCLFSQDEEEKLNREAETAKLPASFPLFGEEKL